MEEMEIGSPHDGGQSQGIRFEIQNWEKSVETHETLGLMKTSGMLFVVFICSVNSLRLFKFTFLITANS
jgi:hypothetical protein